MRLRMLARRVMNTVNVENAMPPRNSFKPVLSLVVGWGICGDGWDGVDVEDAEGILSETWVEGGFSSWLGALESGLGLEPQLKKDSIVCDSVYRSVECDGVVQIDSDEKRCSNKELESCAIPSSVMRGSSDGDLGVELRDVMPNLRRRRMQISHVTFSLHDIRRLSTHLIFDTVVYYVLIRKL